MKYRFLVACISFLLLPAIGAFADVSSQEPGSQSTSVDASAAYQFALGKLQLAEGDYRGALDALEQAVVAVPNEPYVHLVLAETLLRIGRMEPAIEHAEAAVELAPSDIDILGGAGRVLVSFGDRDPAVGDRGEQHFQRVLELDSENLETLHVLGSLFQRRGDLAGAEEYFSRLASLQPGARSAGVLLQLLLDQGKKAEAVVLLGEVLEHSPGELEMRLTLADLLVEQGDHLAAAKVLQEAPEDMGENVELARRVSVELYRAGDTEGALATLEEVLAKNPDPRLRLFQGLMLAETGQPEPALAVLNALHQEELADPEIALSLARLLAQARRPNEASAVLRETLGAMQDPVAEERVRIELAQTFASTGNWSLALEQGESLRDAQAEPIRRTAALIRVDSLLALERANEAISEIDGLGADLPPELTAKKAEALFRLDRDSEGEALLSGLEPANHAVEVYQRLGRYEDSIPLLTGMVAEDPESLQARFWLGAAYERTGQAGEAEGQFKELVRLYPDFHLGLNYLGYMYAERGENLQEALSLIQRAVGLDPGNGAYIDSLGWVYFQLGNYDEAVTHLRQATHLVPDDGTVFEHLGDAYRALGDHGEARDAYRKALGLELDDPEKVEGKLQGVEAPEESGSVPNG